MSDKTTKQHLEEMSFGELRTRRTLGLAIIKLLEEEWYEEEGAAEALDKYKAQYYEINNEVKRRVRKKRREAGVEEPPRQVIKAKAARIGARRRMKGEA